MNLIDVSVRRPAVTALLFLLMASLGVTAWSAIPRQEDPSFPIPIVNVVAVLPGATPVDLERLVARPIEERLGELENLESIDTRISGDVAVIRAEFLVKVDAEQKYGEVQREVDAVRDDLPDQLALLEVRRVTSLDVNIVQLALVSETASDDRLDRLAEELEDRIEEVAGVRAAERWGEAERQVRVSLDLGRLAQLGIPAGAVLNAVGGESADIPGGAVAVGTRQFSVRTSGSYDSPEDVAATVVTGSRDAVVRVGDLAQVEWASADPTYLARHDG
ncbi:MAG: efflux RND transporter permease subunit, partial [Gemmatimonadales bacterium]|nr:efflux RND transporter permease subunit [Gemmatimonadales bacterium]